MKAILIVYKTKTGFTKKYVDWIAEEITCQVIPYEQINSVDINLYDIIVYGAGMHAGRIEGLKEFKKNVLNLDGKKIVVFATGATPYEAIISSLKTNNFSENELNDINLFYFESGMNYEKMGVFDKAIMKTFSKILELKKSKSDIEKGTIKAISDSYDHSSREFIKPIVDYLDQLQNKSSTEKCFAMKEKG